MGTALESSKRHYQILIEGVDDYAIFVLDTAGRVASWNNAAKQIIGYTSDEIVGKHFAIFYRPDERRSGEPNRALELAVQRGKHEVEGWRIRKNGTLFFVTGSVSSILDNKGHLIGFANIIRDATERRDAQEKLVQAREQLAMAQKMEAIGKLTGGIAHDFNNLLMIIGGNAQTFKRLLDPKLPRAIEAIQTAAKRGESLTRQLLTFSRRQHLSPTVVDLNACIRNIRPMIESSLRGNIVYDEKIGAGVWPVKVDLAELELAIVNIAVNARDAMPNGGKFSYRRRQCRRPITTARTARTANSSPSTSAIPAPAFLRISCPRSSIRSSRPRKSARAPGSACRRFMASPTRPAAWSTPTARSAKEPPSRSTCRRCRPRSRRRRQCRHRHLADAAAGRPHRR